MAQNAGYAATEQDQVYHLPYICPQILDYSSLPLFLIDHHRLMGLRYG